MCCVQEKGLSGLTSYTWTRADARAIDKGLVKYLRVLMTGPATTKVEGERMRTMSNVRVFRHWRMSPTCLELCVRRLRWLQDMTKYQEESAQVVACIWGRLRCEGFGTLDDNGHLTEQANSYAWLLNDDMQSLRRSGCADTFF